MQSDRISQADEARKLQMERYRRLQANAYECRKRAERAGSVAEAMRLVRQADEWAARAYHEVA